MTASAPIEAIGSNNFSPAYARSPVPIWPVESEAITGHIDCHELLPPVGNPCPLGAQCILLLQPPRERAKASDAFLLRLHVDALLLAYYQAIVIRWALHQ